MKRYFRAEFPNLGGYTAYYEYDGEWVSRQIDLFPDIVLLLVVPEASDLRLSDSGRTPDQEITLAEFDQLWAYYSTLPHGTKRTDSPLLKAPWFEMPKSDD